MNNRIREIAEHVGYMPLPGFGFANNLQEVFLEKFAELIVKECISVARRQRNPSNLNYKPSERFVEELQQYFGVKE